MKYYAVTQNDILKGDKDGISSILIKIDEGLQTLYLQRQWRCRYGAGGGAPRRRSYGGGWCATLELQFNPSRVE